MAKLSAEERNTLPESAFAFPRQRKEPLVDGHHVQEALARFDQVDDVSNAERDEAWKRIQQAAKKFDIEVQEKDWRDLFKNSGHPLPKQ